MQSIVSNAGEDGEFVLLDNDNEIHDEEVVDGRSALELENARLHARLLELEKNQEWVVDSLAKGAETERAELLKAVLSLTDERNALEQELKHSEKEFASIVSVALEERLQSFRTQYMKDIPGVPASASPAFRGELQLTQQPHLAKLRRSAAMCKKGLAGVVHQAAAVSGGSITLIRRNSVKLAHWVRDDQRISQLKVALTKSGVLPVAALLTGAILGVQQRQAYMKRQAQQATAMLGEEVEVLPTVDMSVTSTSGPWAARPKSETVQGIFEAAGTTVPPSEPGRSRGLFMVEEFAHFIASQSALDTGRCPVAQYLLG